MTREGASGVATLDGERTLLRIHLDSGRRVRGRPLVEHLVEQARHAGLAGATVLEGHSGFVGRGPLLEPHALRVRQSRPLVLELVEDAAALERYLDDVEPLLAPAGALVTLERARVIRYRSRA